MPIKRYQGAKINSKFFSSKLVEKERDISKLPTSFENQIEKMSVNNIVGGEIKAAKF